MNIMDIFPDPDTVAGSEYRLLWDYLDDALMDCRKAERLDTAKDVLKEIISAAQDMIRVLERQEVSDG